MFLVTSFELDTGDNEGSGLEFQASNPILSGCTQICTTIALWQSWKHSHNKEINKLQQQVPIMDVLIYSLTFILVLNPQNNYWLPCSQNISFSTCYSQLMPLHQPLIATQSYPELPGAFPWPVGIALAS